MGYYWSTGVIYRFTGNGLDGTEDNPTLYSNNEAVNTNLIIIEVVMQLGLRDSNNTVYTDGFKSELYLR